MRTISHTYRQITITACLAVSLFLFCSSVAFAQDAYQPLTGIPGVDPDNLSLTSYVNALFLLSIALGAMLAVIKIVIAGFKYMFTDAVPVKTDAKSDIYGALLGLGILLATFVALWTINPQLVELDILQNGQEVELVPNPEPSPTNPNTGCPQGTQLIVSSTSPEGTCKAIAPFTCGGGDVSCYSKCIVTGGHLDEEDALGNLFFSEPFDITYKCRYDRGYHTGANAHEVARVIGECLAQGGEYKWVGPQAAVFGCVLPGNSDPS